MPDSIGRPPTYRSDVLTTWLPRQVLVTQYVPIGGSKGMLEVSPLPSRSNFFPFHAVFTQYQIIGWRPLSPLGKLDPPLFPTVVVGLSQFIPSFSIMNPKFCQIWQYCVDLRID